MDTLGGGGEEGGVLSTVERLSLSQRLLMCNGHTGGVGVLSTVERLFLFQRLLMYQCFKHNYLQSCMYIGS